MKQTVCNMCGKTFDMEDEANDFTLYARFGYGSKRDGDNFNLDLCCECCDKFVDELVEKCKVDPVTVIF